MKIHLSVSLGAKEVIWQTAEWCVASQKGEKREEMEKENDVKRRRRRNVLYFSLV